MIRFDSAIAKTDKPLLLGALIIARFFVMTDSIMVGPITYQLDLRGCNAYPVGLVITKKIAKKLLEPECGFEHIRRPKPSDGVLYHA